MTDKRIALINEDGTCEVGGVVCRLVPAEPTDEHCAKAVCIARVWPMDDVNVPREFIDIIRNYNAAMLSAAAIDLSSLPRVPQRKIYTDMDGTAVRIEKDSWNAALDAMGIK